MKLIVCVDDGGGMSFGGRRQSRDRLLRQRVLALTQGQRLWMNAYSQKQFANEAAQLCIHESFLDRASAGDYCFVETLDPAPYARRVEALLLYRWNRRYPADQRLTLDYSGWKLQSRKDFAGFSHEMITEEIYIP